MEPSVVRLSPPNAWQLIVVNRPRDNAPVRTAACALCLALALGTAPPGAAQQHERPNGVFLVAKPGLADPNFRETVVLVTQTTDGGTVGVIVNRPTRVQLRERLPGLGDGAEGRALLYFGGPVMPQAVVALFEAREPPKAPAFHVLRDVYLSMHPDNVRALIGDAGRRHRLYAGFSGWSPGQLESELRRDSWYIVSADAETAFRGDLRHLWQELLRRAKMRRVSVKDSPPRK